MVTVCVALVLCIDCDDSGLVLWAVLAVWTDVVDMVVALWSALVLWLTLVECEGTDEVTVRVWLALVVWPVLVASDAVEVTVLEWLPLDVCVPALVLPD